MDHSTAVNGINGRSVCILVPAISSVVASKPYNNYNLRHTSVLFGWVISTLSKMAGVVNTEMELAVGNGREKYSAFPMKRFGDSNNDNRTSDNMDVEDGPVMHFPAANWPIPASGLNAANPSTTNFTLLYNGNICVYDGIPAEKVHEIMLIAAAYAKSTEMKSVQTQRSFNPLIIPTSPPSPQAGTSNNLASQQSVCFPAEKSSIRRLQDEFPIARRQSLQTFLEKRRVRLGGKASDASCINNKNGWQLGEHIPC